MWFTGLGYNCIKDIILNTIEHELSIELSNVFNMEDKSVLGGKYGDGNGRVKITTRDENDNGVLYFDIEYVEDYNILKKCLNNIIKKYNLNNLQGFDFSFICKDEKKLLYTTMEGKRFTYYSIYLSFSQNFYHLFDYCYSKGIEVDSLYLNDNILLSYDIFEDRIVKKVYVDGEFVEYGYSDDNDIKVDDDKILNDMLHNNFSNIVFKYNYHNRPFKSPMEVELGSSTVNIAKDIRNALKVICKDIKFSVRKSNFNKINVKTDEVIDKDLGEYIKKTVGCFNHQADLLSKYDNDLIIDFNF